MSNAHLHPLETDVQSVKRKLDAGGDFTLLDCREPDEYETAKIAGAKLVPMSTISTALAGLEPLKTREVVVHCHHGGRSMRVVKWLVDQGFENVKSMAGGIDQWSEWIDPSVPRY